MIIWIASLRPSSSLPGEAAKNNNQPNLGVNYVSSPSCCWLFFWSSCSALIKNVISCSWPIKILNFFAIDIFWKNSPQKQFVHLPKLFLKMLRNVQQSMYVHTCISYRVRPCNKEEWGMSTLTWPNLAYVFYNFVLHTKLTWEKINQTFFEINSDKCVPDQIFYKSRWPHRLTGQTADEAQRAAKPIVPRGQWRWHHWHSSQIGINRPCKFNWTGRTYGCVGWITRCQQIKLLVTLSWWGRKLMEMSLNNGGQ